MESYPEVVSLVRLLLRMRAFFSALLSVLEFVRLLARKSGTEKSSGWMNWTGGSHGGLSPSPVW